eukprot:TRINITY_DN4221_c0_g4_i1.p1 TRINITY_DN4221_c0_g4~~TRINITY_DN4221_c0_g4_i1.p1  ORF type:complete len:2994 (-),score=598.74 TRINITY_DN4221_c0_g4_i1:26-9007(-)
MPLGQWSGHIWPSQTDSLPAQEVGSEANLKLKASWQESLNDKRKRKSVASSAWAASHAFFESETNPSSSRSTRRQSQHGRSRSEKPGTSLDTKPGRKAELRDKQDALLAKQTQVVKSWARPDVTSDEGTTACGGRQTYMSADRFREADSEREDSSWHEYQQNKNEKDALYNASVRLAEVEVSTSMVKDVVERFQRAYERAAVPEQHPADPQGETIDFLEEEDYELISLSKDAVAAYSVFGKMEGCVHGMETLLRELMNNIDGMTGFDDDLTELERKTLEDDVYRARTHEVLFGGLAFVEGMGGAKDAMAQAKVKQVMDQIFELLSELSMESERFDFDAWLALIKEDEETCQEMFDDFNYGKDEVKRLLTVSHLETDEALHNRILLTVLTFTRWFDKVRRAADQYDNMTSAQSNAKQNKPNAALTTRRKAAAGNSSQTALAQAAFPLDVGYIPDYQIDLRMPDIGEMDKPAYRRLLLTRLTELREKTRRKLGEASVLKLSALKDNVSDASSVRGGPRIFREPKSKKAPSSDKDRNIRRTVIVTERVDENRKQTAESSVQNVTNEQTPQEHKSQPKQVATKQADRNVVADRMSRIMGVAKGNHDEIFQMRQALQGKEHRAKDLILKAFIYDRKEKRRHLRQSAAPFWSINSKLDERPSPGRSFAIHGMGEGLIAANDEEDQTVKHLLFQQSVMCHTLNNSVVKVELMDIWTGEEGKYLRSRPKTEQKRKPKRKETADKRKDKDKEKGRAPKQKVKSESGTAFKRGLSLLIVDSKEEEEAQHRKVASESSESEDDATDLSKLPTFLSANEIQIILADAIDKRDAKLDRVRHKIEKLLGIACKHFGSDAWTFSAVHLIGEFHVCPWQLLVPAIDAVLGNFLSKGGYNLSREDQSRLRGMRAQLNKIKGQISDELLLKGDAKEKTQDEAANHSIADWAMEQPMRELVEKVQALHLAVESRLKRAAIPEIRDRLIPELGSLHPDIQQSYGTQPRQRSAMLRRGTAETRAFELATLEEDSPRIERASMNAGVNRKFKAAVKMLNFTQSTQRAAEEARGRTAVEEQIERLEAKLERTEEAAEDEQILIKKLEREKAASAELLETLQRYFKIQTGIQDAKDELMQLRFRTESQERQKHSLEATRIPAMMMGLQDQSDAADSVMTRSSRSRVAVESAAYAKTVESVAKPRLRFEEQQSDAGEQPQSRVLETKLEEPSSAKGVPAAKGLSSAFGSAKRSSTSSSNSADDPGDSEGNAGADSGGREGVGIMSGSRMQNVVNTASIRRKLSLFFTADISKKLQQAAAKHKGDKDLVKPMRDSMEANRVVEKIAETRRRDMNKMLQTIATKLGSRQASIFESMKQKLSRWNHEMSNARSNLAAANDLEKFWQQRWRQWMAQLREEYSDEVALLVAGRDEYEEKEWLRHLEKALIHANQKRVYGEAWHEAGLAVTEDNTMKPVDVKFPDGTEQESQKSETARRQPHFMSRLLQKVLAKLPPRPAVVSKRTPSWDLTEDSLQSSDGEISSLPSIVSATAVGSKGPRHGLIRAPVKRDVQVDCPLAIGNAVQEKVLPVHENEKTSILNDDTNFAHGMALKILRNAFMKKRRLAEAERGDATSVPVSSEERRKRFDSADLDEKDGSQSPGKKLLLLDQVLTDSPRAETKRKAVNLRRAEEPKMPEKVFRSKTLHESHLDAAKFSRNTVLTSNGFVEMEIIYDQKQSDGTPASVAPINLSDAESEKDLCRNVSTEEPALLLLRKFRRRLFQRYSGAEEAFNNSVFGLPGDGLSKDAFYALALKLRFDDESANNILCQAGLMLGLQDFPDVLHCVEFVQLVKFALPIKSLAALQQRLEHKYRTLTAAYSVVSDHRQMDRTAFRLLVSRVGGSKMEADTLFSDILAHSQGQMHIGRHVFQLVLRNAEGLEAARRLTQALGLQDQLELGVEGRAQAFQSVMAVLEQGHPPSQPFQMHQVMKTFGFSQADSDALRRLGGAIPASCMQERQTRKQDVALAAVAGLGQRAEQLANYLGNDFFGPAPNQKGLVDDPAAAAWRYKKCHYVPLALEYGYGNAGIVKRYKKMLAAEAREGLERATGGRSVLAGIDLVAGKRSQSERKKSISKGKVRRGSVLLSAAGGEQQAWTNAQLEVSPRAEQELLPAAFFIQESLLDMQTDATVDVAVVESGSLVTPEQAAVEVDGALQQVERQPGITKDDHELNSQKHEMLRQLQVQEAHGYVRRLCLFGGDQMQIQSAVQSMQEFRKVILNKFRGPRKAFEKLAGVGKEWLELSKMHEKSRRLLSLTASDALRIVAVLETFDESPKLDLPKLVRALRFGTAVPNLMEFKKILVQGYGSVKAAVEVSGLSRKQEIDVGIMQAALAPFGIAEADAHRIFHVADIAQPGGQRHELSSDGLFFALKHAHIFTWMEAFCRRSLAAGTNAATAILEPGRSYNVSDIATFEDVMGPLGFPSQFTAATFDFFRQHNRGTVSLLSISQFLKRLMAQSDVGRLSVEHKSDAPDEGHHHGKGEKANASNISDEDRQAAIVATRKLIAHVEQTCASHNEAFSYLSGKTEENNPGMNLQQWTEAMGRSGLTDSHEWELVFGYMTDWRQSEQGEVELKVYPGNFSKVFEEARPCRSLVEFRDRLQKKFGGIQKAWTYIAEKEGAGEVTCSRWHSALVSMSVPADDAGQLLALVQAAPTGNLGSHVNHTVIAKKSFSDAMTSAEVSTRLFQLLERLSCPTGTTVRTVTEAFEKLNYDRAPLSATYFQHALAEHFQVQDQDAKMYFRFLDVHNDGFVMVDHFLDVLVAMQTTYLPFHAFTFISKSRQMIADTWQKTRMMVKTKLALSAITRRTIVASSDAEVKRKDKRPSAFSPMNVHTDITQTDIQSCRSASACSAVPEGSVSSCSGAQSAALTSASTALPPDSDSEDDARNAARPWSSMSAAARITSTGAAMKRLQAQRKLQNLRQPSASTYSRGPSPLPQLDLASVITFVSRPSLRQVQPKAQPLPRLHD